MRKISKKKFLLLLCTLTGLRALTDEVKAFIERVLNDGGIIESPECIDNPINADIHFQPSGYKVGVAYSQKGIDGIDDFDVSRASTQTRINKEGNVETLANDVPSYDYIDGDCPVLALPPLSANLYLNSEVSNVENTTVTATPYTVFLYGTGTITFSGAYVGTLVGTGVKDKVEVTFTPSAGTLTSTDSGSIVRKQIENLPYSTPYILTTGSTQVRLLTLLNNSGDVTSYNSLEGSLFVRVYALYDSLENRTIYSISDGTVSNRTFIRYSTVSNRIQAFFFVGGVSQGTLNFVVDDITLMKNLLLIYAVDRTELWIDGVKVAEKNNNIVPPIDTFNTGGFNTYNGSSVLGFNIEKAKYYKRALTSQEAEDLTTNGTL